MHLIQLKSPIKVFIDGEFKEGDHIIAIDYKATMEESTWIDIADVFFFNELKSLDEYDLSEPTQVKAYNYNILSIQSIIL